MIVTIKATAHNIEESYDQVAYVPSYATIVVNPAMPTRKKFLQFEDDACNTKLIASNGKHEIIVDHFENTLLIKSHREYRCSINYDNDFPAPAMILSDDEYLPERDVALSETALRNTEAAARWIREHKATFNLARVCVHVDSEQRVLTITVNEDSDVRIDEDAVM